MEPKEKEVALWWRRGVRGRPGLVTATGEALEVLEPGLPSSAGPDFQGAVVVVGGRGRRGDVEVHRRASTWRTHRHHRDPRYNQVMLQAVLWADLPAVRREDGAEVPVVRLGGGEAAPGCAGGLEPEALAPALETWGEERFRLRARALAGEMAQEAPGQVLYGALMEALGYPTNREPFCRLAREVPLPALEAFPEGAEERLLTAARGLPWRGWGWRPANHPCRRLRGMVRLLARFSQGGLLKGLMGVVQEAPGPQELEEALIVGGEKPALIGRERAGEMAVNALLPFAVAHGEEPLRERSLTLFSAYPALEENRITRHMRELLGVGAKMASTARGQQGLLHLYRTACSQGACPHCPLPGLAGGPLS